MLQEKLGSWYPHLKDEFKKGYMQGLKRALQEKRNKKHVFPAPEHLFRCFRECPADKLQTVVLGYCPHETFTNTGKDIKIHADGIAFSYRLYKELSWPYQMPFTTEVFVTELEQIFNAFPPMSPDLTAIARQGVLLYDVIQTTDANAIGSHKGIGWENFSAEVIRACYRINKDVDFIILGKYAEKVFEQGKVPGDRAHVTSHPLALKLQNRKFSLRVLKELGTSVDWIGELYG